MSEGITCCYKCPERHVKCHATCDTYKEAKVELEARKAEVRRRKDLDYRRKK